MIIGKFTEDINPHTIVDSRTLLENIKKFDHRRQFEQFFDFGLKEGTCIAVELRENRVFTESELQSLARF